MKERTDNVGYTGAELKLTSTAHLTRAGPLLGAERAGPGGGV